MMNQRNRSISVFKDKSRNKRKINEYQRCQVELSVMKQISLLQYVKRGRNVCKTRSALPEVAKQPRMLRGSGAMPPEKNM